MKIAFPVLIFLQVAFICKAQDKIYVSVQGNDKNAGTLQSPLQTLAAAISTARAAPGSSIAIVIRGGNYSLDKTLMIGVDDFNNRSLAIYPYSNEKVIITGSKKITPRWQHYKDGILKATIDLGQSPDQLFLNGKAVPMARYPNYDSTARVFNGTAADAISDERVGRWKSPAGGFIHALHEGEWGGFHYRITGKDEKGKLQYEGGWQNNRPAPMHKEYRFVENIFEELDAPGEWFYDQAAKTIFLYPSKNTNLQTAKIAVSVLTDLVHISGSEGKPVKNISIRNIAFTETARSFMLVKEPLLRSDWTVYRGGAILVENAENINISNCSFYELGGNAVFVSNYAKNVQVTDNHIFHIGANAIAFVGSPEAVRSPAFRYEQFVPWDSMDYTPGARSNTYPQFCTASGNLIHDIGTIEKQVTGVELEMTAHITVRHNSIYHTPRSGINIGDGCWGGHLIEYNDVFNTVLETGDHGAFNSWGRDRYWRPERSLIDSIVGAKPGIELLDAGDAVVIRHNRFRCDHGWDIDLDDGSSNYLIYGNVCLNGGLKLREGYHRTVSNNILINNSFHPHVWLRSSEDVFVHNIVTTAYAPILMDNWGKKIDSNFFLSPQALANAQQLNLDKNSIAGDPQFLNAAAGNYEIKPGSPAQKIGFKSFKMDFGVTLPALKKIAAVPEIKPLLTNKANQHTAQADWLGAAVKNIETAGERSAAGLHDDNGVMVMKIAAQSLAAKNDLQKGDVIIQLDDKKISSVNDLLQSYQAIKWRGSAECVIVRNQAEKKINISFK